MRSGVGGDLTTKSIYKLDQPQWLYHYTSIYGVEGILTSKCIWASLLHFMNDSREWLYGLDLVRQYLQGQAKAREDRNWLAFIAGLSESLRRIQGLNICVFSLSAESNQLSQWRAYCPPEGGYEVIFDRKTLEEHLVRHGFELKPCIYDVDVQLQIVSTIIAPIITRVGELKDDRAMNDAIEEALSKLASQLSVVAPVLKHPDFKEEKEWRAFALVASNDARMHYHIKGSLVIPHCSLDLETHSSRFPVTQITVGPNAHQLLAMRGIEALKSKVTIGRSETPLRSF